MQQLSYATIAGLVQAAEEAGVPLSHLVLADQAQQLERTPQSLWEQMDQSLAVMEESAQMGMRPDIRSTSGLTGGSAFKMRRWAESGRSLTGSLMAGALYRARTGGASCSFQPVAGPTAGQAAQPACRRARRTTQPEAPPRSGNPMLPLPMDVRLTL